MVSSLSLLRYNQVSYYQRYRQWRRATCHNRQPLLLWFAGFCFPQSKLYWRFVWPLQSVCVRLEYLRLNLWDWIRFEAIAVHWLLFYPALWKRYDQLANVSWLAWLFWHLTGPTSFSLSEWLYQRALLAPPGRLWDKARWYRSAAQAKLIVRRARKRYYRHAFAWSAGWDISTPLAYTGQVFDLGGAMLNVENPAYGLVGDGVTDNFTQLSNMITNNVTTAGAWLFFPEGTFVFSGSIHPQGLGPTRMSGAGIGITILMPTAANAAQIFIATSNITKITDLWIGFLTFDGNVANRASGNVLVQPRGIAIRFMAVSFQNATDWNTKVFQATSIGSIDTTLHRTQGVRITNSEMYGTGDGWTLNGLDNFQIAFNYGYGVGHNHIDLNSCHGGVVACNISMFCGGLASLSAEGNGLLLFSNTANGGFRDVAVYDQTSRSCGQAQYGVTTTTSRDGIRFTDDGTTAITGTVIGGSRCYDDFNLVTDTLKAAITTAPAAGTVETWNIPNNPYKWPYLGTVSISIVSAGGTETLRAIAGLNKIGGQAWTVVRGENGTTPVAHAANDPITGIQMQAYGVRANVSVTTSDVQVDNVNVNSGGRVANALVVAGIAKVVYRSCSGLNPYGSAVATPAVATPTTFTPGVDSFLTYIANAAGTTMTLNGKAMSPTPANAMGSLFIPQGSVVSYNNAPASWALVGN